MLWRSLLFAPANRPDLAAKLPRTGADICVLDLEDGTPPAERTAARSALEGTVAASRGGNASARCVFVRVNPADTLDFAEDLAAARASGADGVVLPKAEAPTQISAIGTALPIIAGIESAWGVAQARAVAAAPGVAALYFGAEDFAADIGARRSRAGLEVLHARSEVILAARLAGVRALDQVVLDIRDDDLFRADAGMGRDLGYDGKMCLLPRQVAIANAVFSPAPAEVDHARRLVGAYRAAAEAGRGTIDFEGRMIDGPALKAALAILEQAAQIAARSA